MKKNIFLLSSSLLLAFGSYSQLVIQSGATVFLESGAKLTVEGDLTSSESIQGTGTVVMKGAALQNLSMNGFTIPNLEIDNTANVTLQGSNTEIGTNLLFTNGKILTSSHDLVLSATATISSANTSRFVWTNGTGMLKKKLTADISNYELPVGENTNYRPVYLTSTGGSYSNATVGVRSVNGASPNKPPSIASAISAYWPVSKSGITGGIQTLVGQYLDPADVSGTEANLAGYYFNGVDWSSANETNNPATNQVSARITAASGELTAMNKFIAVGTRAFLQGAYSTTTGLMSDALRAGTNVIPVADPYRTAPYNSSFTHVANVINEIASGAVFNNQASANDDIVDWVFLELRNTASPGNTVLQTRSALIQRDGDIVDVDGTSPVTFNNHTNGNFTIAVRHRNHLGVASLPSSPRSFSEAKSTAFSANVADLRLTTTQMNGTSGTNFTTASHPTLTTVNLLWGGNANSNANTRYTGLSNDKDHILVNLLGNNSFTVLNNIYSSGDINMNKNVRYTGLANDKDFLYISVLQSNTVTVRSQLLPN